MLRTSLGRALARPCARPPAPSLLRRAAHLPRSPRTYAEPPPRQPEPAHDGAEPSPEDEEPDGRRRSGRVLFWVFFAISTPLAVASLFHPKDASPQPDFLSPEALPHADKPISAILRSGEYSIAKSVFFYRLLRGDYAQFMRENFMFTPINGTDLDPRPWRWWTLVTHEFAHAGPIHFILCTMAAYHLIPMITLRYGPARTAALFLSSGAAGAYLYQKGLEWRIERAGGVNIGKSGSLLQGEERTALGLPPGRASLEFVTSHLGSSGSLMAMFTVVAISMPQTQWGVILIPISFSARVFWAILCAWDVHGAFIRETSDGIGHGAHLCGDVAGAVFWALFLRGRKPPAFLY